jgi:lipid-A-disaccharide synthase
LAWLTWWIARSIVQVPYVAMPNLLAGRAVYPELLQDRANAEAIAHEAETLLRGSRKRLAMVKELEQVRSLLGAPGACERAATHVIDLLAGEGQGA